MIGICPVALVYLKVKDAIVDRQREACGGRSSIRPVRPHVKVDLHLRRDLATVSLDLSGEALSNRGYRVQGGEAPLRENLAAAVLLRAGWQEIARRGASLLDPMCGTGTLLIEGALIAGEIAPGLTRRYYGFIGWKQFPSEVWSRAVREAEIHAAAKRPQIPRIVGGDADPRAVAAALANAAATGLTDVIEVDGRSITELAPPVGVEDGLVVINPPYGHRMGRNGDLKALYTTIGLRLRQTFSGWRAAVLVEQDDLGHRLGLRAHKMHRLYNGALPVRLLHFNVGPAAVRARKEGAASHKVATHADAPDLRNRLRKNLRHLGRWARREGVTCYRVYDRDLPDYNFALDVYEDWALLQEYDPPSEIEQAAARRRRDAAFAVVRELLGLEQSQLFFRLRERQRGSRQYTRRALLGELREAREGGLRFLVNPSDYLDTGLFLDQRITRSLVREQAQGRRFLNLFCYTATATVCAVAGGAVSSTSVDLSRTYLAWGKENLALNGYDGSMDPRSGTHRLVQSDCLRWLAGAAGERNTRFDLVYADVPTFSNSRQMEGTFDVQRDHVTLLAAVAGVLAPEGVVLFSTNKRRFRLDEERLLMEAGLYVRDITARTIPPDFALRAAAHRCWILHASR